MTTGPTLFFDLDDTLINDDAAIIHCLEQTCLALAESTPGFDFLAVAQTYYESSIVYKQQGGSGHEDLGTARRRMWSEALSPYNFDAPDLAARAAELYAKSRADFVVVFEETVAVLEELHAHHAMAVLTNGPGDLQRSRLQIAGLRGHFDYVIASTDIGAGKPQLPIFQAALTALEADPSSTWHIGDSLIADVGGAINAGLRAIWMNRNGFRPRPEDPKPHAEIANLRELLVLLK